MKFHFNKEKGEAGECRAKTDESCPMGGAPHSNFATKKEAGEWAETLAGDGEKIMPTVSKNGASQQTGQFGPNIDHTRPLWADLPHGESINALFDELRTLTDNEARDMVTTWRTTWYATPLPAWDAAFGAALNAMTVAERTAEWGVARDATWEAAQDTEWEAEWYAARDAALALVVADQAGQHGLTREHLDILTSPARTIPRLAPIIDRALPSDGGQA